ncbi:MAG: NAD(P)-dependent oxidoreductase [Candidatus Melainabacteria bacterium]|nr:NAD(P)-dependent oxidoreductase [Candidatus Melainabacteria bacterium]
MNLQNKRLLITGGAGFFGGLLKQTLLNNGFDCISIDLENDDFMHPNLSSIKCDIRNKDILEGVFRKNKFDAIFHCAAILAHSVNDKEFLWESNVVGTRNIAELAKKYKVPKIIFTSSNCLWGKNFQREVKEEDIPKPVEIYGESKLEAEEILLQYTKDFYVIIFRCPTIVDYGRLGLLAILFEFIDEGRKVWVLGSGDNKYQFIYAQDLINACIKALDYNQSDVFNIGSDNVKTFKEVYEFVIKKANTGAKVESLPCSLTLFFMKVCYALKLSPLGPYQYKMIAESFIFNTDKIKEKLNWKPTLTNEEMLYKAYEYYHENINDIKNRSNVSAHKQAAKMGIIKLLKWLS